MPLYDSVNGVARKVVRMYDSVDGVAREVTKAYTCVNGVARLYYTGNIPLRELPIGTEIYTNVAGEKTAFIVVHQGKPDSTSYDSSCDGTWLLSKYIYDIGTGSIAPHSFINKKSSEISYTDLQFDYYLNTHSTSFLKNLDPEVQKVVKTVNIPYHTYNFHYMNHPITGELSHAVSDRISSFKTKVFLLSYEEIASASDIDKLSRLSYFQTNNMQELQEKRTGYRVVNDVVHSGAHWCLRDYKASSFLGIATKDIDNLTIYLEKWVSITGFSFLYHSLGVQLPFTRPAFILPSNVRVDDNFNIITE